MQGLVKSIVTFIISLYQRKETIEVETEEELLFRAQQHEEAASKAKKQLLEDTISSPWVMEDELTFTPMPDLEAYDMDDDDTLKSLLSSIKVRIETRDNNEEETARVGRTLRKVQSLFCQNFTFITFPYIKFLSKLK